jgi:branched-chain amino acid aminotransferase
MCRGGTILAEVALQSAQHYVDGTWLTGNPTVIGLWDHATWLGSAVFDGARAFDGWAPDLDLHCQRAIRSARTIGLEPKITAAEIERLAREGIRRFAAGTHLYIRPFFWAADGEVQPDPTSTRFALSIAAAPIPEPNGIRVTLSPLRRPTEETAPTGAKAVGLYTHSGMANAEARKRGFHDGIMLDQLGHVAELTSSNLWIVKNGVAITPIPNGTFLNGLTRQRIVKLLTAAGLPVQERTVSYQEVLEADEAFASGNYSKVQPIVGIEQRSLAYGPVTQLARKLYWDFAKTHPA